MGEPTIKLKRIEYNEGVLVDKICSEVQRKTYHKKDRFTGGSTQRTFWEKLSRYCDYTYDPATKKYKILEVYKYPKTSYEAKIHKGIYQYIAPMMLNEVLFGKSSGHRRGVITTLDLANTIGLVNDNYNHVKFHQDEVHIDLGFSKRVLSEYFNKADNRIDDYIRRCIKYLKIMNCAFYDEVHMIMTMPKTILIEKDRIVIEEGQIRIATKEEMELYSSLVEEASKRAKINTDNEKWYGKKAAKYNSELSNLLREHGIKFICKAFKLHKVDEERCKSVLKSFADKTLEQRRREAGYMLSAMMNANAEIRLVKNPCLGDDYLDQFKELSDIVMMADAPDILSELPSVDGHSQKRLFDKRVVVIKNRGMEKDYGVE